MVDEALEILGSAKLKLNGVDQDLASAYQMVANARGSNFINFDVLNIKDLGSNTQKAIDKMIDDIKISVDTINKIAEVQEDKKPDASVVANDYVIVNPTSSNEPKTSAEYNRGFAMGVKSSFIVAGSVVAAGYLMKGVEGMFKKVLKKDDKKEKKRIQMGIQTTIPPQNAQQLIHNQAAVQTPQQQVVQQVVQVPQIQQQAPVVQQPVQQVVNNPVQ